MKDDLVRAIPYTLREKRGIGLGILVWTSLRVLGLIVGVLTAL